MAYKTFTLKFTPDKDGEFCFSEGDNTPAMRSFARELFKTRNDFNSYLNIAVYMEHDKNSAVFDATPNNEGHVRVFKEGRKYFIEGYITRDWIIRKEVIVPIDPSVF